MSEEKWIPIRGYEGRYEAGDLGHIRSMPRVTTQGRQLLGGLLKPMVNAHGYLLVSLWADGHCTTKRVHNLVMQAFVGPPTPGQQVRHLDGRKSNNQLSNLAYGTQSENERDKVQHGTSPYLNKTHCPSGHEYTPENTRYGQTGSGRRCRHCKACERKRKIAARVLAASA